jgi:hypothetical protein
MSITSSTRYATDEDIALRAPSDFMLLCPRDQRLASGTDGFVIPESASTLVSPSLDFQDQGVREGHLILLRKANSGLRASGEMFVAAKVESNTILLRRKGKEGGKIQPLATTNHPVNDIEYQIFTLEPQLGLASDDIEHRFGITNGRCPGRFQSELADVTELRDVVVLSVLYRQYLDMSRDLSSDDFRAKSQTIKSELDETLGRLSLHWNNASERNTIGSSTTRFSTRMSR